MCRKRGIFRKRCFRYRRSNRLGFRSVLRSGTLRVFRNISARVLEKCSSFVVVEQFARRRNVKRTSVSTRTYATGFVIDLSAARKPSNVNGSQPLAANLRGRTDRGVSFVLYDHRPRHASVYPRFGTNVIHSPRITSAILLYRSA